MKKLLVLSMAFFTALTAQADVVVGRFGQALDGGYRDICVARDGRHARWITKDCEDCKERKGGVVKVERVRGENAILIDKIQFDVTHDGNGLFHASMGAFGKGAVFESPRTCNL